MQHLNSSQSAGFLSSRHDLDLLAGVQQPYIASAGLHQRQLHQTPLQAEDGSRLSQDPNPSCPMLSPLEQTCSIHKSDI